MGSALLMPMISVLTTSCGYSRLSDYDGFPTRQAKALSNIRAVRHKPTGYTPRKPQPWILPKPISNEPTSSIPLRDRDNTRPPNAFLLRQFHFPVGPRGPQSTEPTNDENGVAIQEDKSSYALPLFNSTSRKTDFDSTIGSIYASVFSSPIEQFYEI